MTVDTVWTDFGGVLTPPVDDALENVATAAGVSSIRLLAAIRSVAAKLGMDLLEPLERGRLTQRDWGRRVAAELAPDGAAQIDLGQFGDYWYAGRALNEPLLDRLVSLRSQGLRLGLLTNSVAEWEPHRAAMFAGREPFDAVVNSHELGLRKPEPEIYHYAEEALPGPGRLLIDDLAVNCSAARDRGWIAIHHHGTETTLTELDRLFPGLPRLPGLPSSG